MTAKEISQIIIIIIGLIVVMSCNIYAFIDIYKNNHLYDWKVSTITIVSVDVAILFISFIMWAKWAFS